MLSHYLYCQDVNDFNKIPLLTAVNKFNQYYCNRSLYINYIYCINCSMTNNAINTTRTRAVQHKCLPFLACINPLPLLFKN